MSIAAAIPSLATMDSSSQRQNGAVLSRPENPRAKAPASAFARVLVGFGSAPGAPDALKLGTALAGTGGELILTSVRAGAPEAIAPGAYGRLVREEEDRIAREATPLLGGRKFEVSAIAGGTAAEGLRAIATDASADLIAIGSTHRGLVGRVLLGSVGERVLDGAPCAVAIAPRGLASRNFKPRRVLVGCDGSPESLAAVKLAGTVAAANDSQLTLLGVVEMRFTLAGLPRPTEPAEVARLEQALEHAASSLPPALAPTIREVHGVPAEVIAAAGHEADLLVVGSRGHYGPLRRTMLGSVAAKLARTAPCPTLITPT